jgi:multisubunit Na+/H+ antiporter MnhB subunit
MFNSKKLNFWRLSFVFIGITVLILFMLWSLPQESKATMMNTSMGNMMKTMHVSNINVPDLLSQSEYPEQMAAMNQMHSNQAPIIYKLSFITTSLIFILLPFIIGGTIILALVWLK